MERRSSSAKSLPKVRSNARMKQADKQEKNDGSEASFSPKPRESRRKTKGRGNKNKKSFQDSIFPTVPQADDPFSSIMPPRILGLPFSVYWPPPNHLDVTPHDQEPLGPECPPVIRDAIMQEENCKTRSRNSAERGRLVYRYEMIEGMQNNTAVNVQANIAPVQRIPEPFYHPTNYEDKTLVFESRFECGNLQSAFQVSEFEYDLLLSPDVNTNRHTQWFYFSIQNTRAGQTYTFNINNLLKPASLFNEGMKPVYYSEADAAVKGIGWIRKGENISYFANALKLPAFGRRGLHTLRFSVAAAHDHDTCYLAYHYPYTYTQLQLYLRALEREPGRKKTFRRRALCSTASGNQCDLLTITNFEGDPAAMAQRRGVVFSARVHPGETNSSYVMKGIIDFLTGPSLDAQILRDNFVFKVVPMLNPDGVVVGNYRCNLGGLDLNRRWGEPARQDAPTVFALKLVMRQFAADREVALYVDCHGHSRKKNIFIYGCDNPKGSALHMKEQIYPNLLHDSTNLFNIEGCSFAVEPSKEGTARVVARQELGIPYAFTCEASFLGADRGHFKGHHYGPRDLERMGHHLCDALLDLFDPGQEKADATLARLRRLFREGKSTTQGAEEDSDGSEDESDVQKSRPGGASKSKGVNTPDERAARASSQKNISSSSNRGSLLFSRSQNPMVTPEHSPHGAAAGGARVGRWGHPPGGGGGGGGSGARRGGGGGLGPRASSSPSPRPFQHPLLPDAAAAAGGELLPQLAKTASADFQAMDNGVVTRISPKDVQQISAHAQTGVAPADDVAALVAAEAASASSTGHRASRGRGQGGNKQRGANSQQRAAGGNESGSMSVANTLGGGEAGASGLSARGSLGGRRRPHSAPRHQLANNAAAGNVVTTSRQSTSNKKHHQHI